MAQLRALVCGAALAIALTPLGAAADSSSEHMQAELANAHAQWDLTVVQVGEMRAEGNASAANERSIALLRSEALRESQLGEVANATAMEQIASALANSARTNGDMNARNELAIAQIKAAGLIAHADANIANAIAIGRTDEILNAQAQSAIVHHLADLVSGAMVEQNMNSAKLTAEAQADMIHTPAIAEEKNSLAMGANDLLAADTVFEAGEVAAESATVDTNEDAAAALDHASSSLHNAEVMAADAED